MTSRTTAGTSTVTTAYDNLNRPVLKTYSGARLAEAVTMCYDGRVYGGAAGECTDEESPDTGFAKMRLSETHTATSATRYGYEARGRVNYIRQRTGTDAPYEFTGMTYYPAGPLKTVRYPSGRTLTYGLDLAGRISSINWTAGVYVQSATYAAHGALESLTLGAGKATETWNFTEHRQQPQSIQLSSASGVSAIGIGYGAGTTNNGNIVSETVSHPGAQAVKRLYSYDAVNRIDTAAEYAGGTLRSAPACPDVEALWCEQYGYGAYGNRVVAQRGSGQSPRLDEPSAFSAVTNRATGGNWLYDEAGNNTRDGFGMTATYDGENRVTSTTANSRTVTYGYDGEGRRVTRNAPGGVRTVYVYGPDGQVAAEYGNEAQTVSGPQYVSVDWLGSTRVVLDSDGVIAQTIRYRPFGEEVVSGTAAVAQKFTGKERDGETGLDYFGARYFTGAQGRFTSPDAPLVDQSPEDPQSWNLYSYVRNNPLRFIDPSGRTLQLTGSDWQASFDQLCQTAGDACKDRLSYNQKTGVVSLNTEGLDLSTNEGARVLAEAIGSTSVFAFGLGDTAPTLAGKNVQVDSISNLDALADNRYDHRNPAGKTAVEKPPAGIDSQVIINPKADRVSNTDSALHQRTRSRSMSWESPWAA